MDRSRRGPRRALRAVGWRRPRLRQRKRRAQSSPRRGRSGVARRFNGGTAEKIKIRSALPQAGAEPGGATESRNRTPARASCLTYMLNVYTVYTTHMDSYLHDRERVLEKEMKTLQTQKSAIDLQLALVGKKLDLVRQMLRLESGIADTPIPAGSDVKGLVRQIIEEAGKPLHISEIHRQFLERGYAIPGEGTPFNILAHIVRDKTLARVARGTYALAANTPVSERLPIASPKPRSSRRRKRRS